MRQKKPSKSPRYSNGGPLTDCRSKNWALLFCPKFIPIPRFTLDTIKMWRHLRVTLHTLSIWQNGNSIRASLQFTPFSQTRRSYSPSAVLKIEDSSTAPGHMVFPRSPRILSASQRQVCFQTASFSIELSDWLALSHDTLCGRGCGWACVCGCDCHNAKTSLFRASKSSLTASYFRPIVSNLLSLHVQLPQRKAAFAAPKYCDTSPPERQKQVVSRNAAADGIVLCKFRLVLAPELRNDTSTEQIMHLTITVIWVLFLSMFWGFFFVIFHYFRRLRKQTRIVCCRM